MKNAIFAGLFIATTAATSASAALISFTDRATFLANTGTATDTNTTTDIPFATQIQLGSLLFTADTSLFAGNVVGVREYSSVHTGPEVALSDEDFTIQNVDAFGLPASVYGMGFDVVEPTAYCGGPACIQSTFDISVFSGATLLQTFSFAPDDDQLSFFGVAGNTAFDRFVISEVTGGNEDEYFGNFVTTTQDVPLPAPVLMLGAALFGLGGLRRVARVGRG